MTKLLIVDDEKYVLERLKTSISWEDLGVLIVGTASNGYDAIEIVKEKMPDIILSDVRMPEMDGLQLAEYTKKYFPSIKVILISAYNDFAYAKKGIECGVKGYLLKPIDKHEVEQVFANLINENVQGNHFDNLRQNDVVETEVLIEKAVNYIAQNYENKLTLEEVASYLFITPNYLCSMFKRVMGINFVDYISKVKVQQAKKMLKNSSYKVKDISELLGYNDYTYFCKVFKKIEGTTPLEYRKNIVIGKSY